jgi:hypothetical protein
MRHRWRDPEVTREHAPLKRVLAGQHRNDRESCTIVKAEFISRVLAAR